MKTFVATILNKIYILSASDKQEARSILESNGIYNCLIDEVKENRIKEITVLTTVVVNYA